MLMWNIKAYFALRFLFRFTDINVDWPGGIHDAQVLRNSEFDLNKNDSLFPPLSNDSFAFIDFSFPYAFIAEICEQQ